MLLKAIACSVLLMASNYAIADDVNRISADPELGVFSVEMENGVRALVDQESRTMFLQANGTTIAFTYQQLAELEHPNDSVAQAAFVTELVTQLGSDATPYSLLSTTVTRMATDYSRYGDTYSPGGGGSGIVNSLSPAPLESASVMAMNGDSSNPTLQEGLGGMKDWLGGPCDLGPCTPGYGHNGRIFYSYDSHSERIGHKSPGEQERFRRDYERYKYEKCGIGLETGGQVVGWGSAVLACRLIPAAPTLPTFAGCGLGIAAGLIANGMKNRREQECKRDYPGEGNW